MIKLALILALALAIPTIYLGVWHPGALWFTMKACGIGAVVIGVIAAIGYSQDAEHSKLARSREPEDEAIREEMMNRIMRLGKDTRAVITYQDWNGNRDN